MGCGVCKKLALGVTVYDDYHTAVMTIQSARIISNLSMEVIVADNCPEKGKELKDFCTRIGARYIPVPEPVGTSAPREAIFKNSTAETVCVVDSHVILFPQALTQLVEYADKHPDSMDLWHGPMYYDQLHNPILQMLPQWNSVEQGQPYAPMFGIWDNPKQLPQNAEPFEIQMHGMGLVACHRKAWMTAPEGLRGFGGCEGMIHEHFRQVGRKVLCLPFLKWWHFFRDQTQPSSFPNTLNDRCRNYLIYALSYGLELDQIKEKFMICLGETGFNKCLEEAQAATKDRPVPSIVQKAWNYANALARHVAAGRPKVGEADYKSRLDICKVCPHRVGEECSICGCPVEDAALWADYQCPDKPHRWTALVAGQTMATTPFPVMAVSASQVERKLLDPTVCPHDRINFITHIDRGEETIARQQAKCQKCGINLTFPEQGNGVEAILQLEIPKIVKENQPLVPIM